MQHSSFPRASVLVLGSNSVQSLVPSTLISQAEALLENHRIEDVVDLADQQRKKLQAMMTVDEHEVMSSISTKRDELTLNAVPAPG